VNREFRKALHAEKPASKAKLTISKPLPEKPKKAAPKQAAPAPAASKQPKGGKGKK